MKYDPLVAILLHCSVLVGAGEATVDRVAQLIPSDETAATRVLNCVAKNFDPFQAIAYHAPLGIVPCIQVTPLGEVAVIPDDDAIAQNIEPFHAIADHD
jgi:hypothetical protein